MKLSATLENDSGGPGQAESDQPLFEEPRGAGAGLVLLAGNESFPWMPAGKDLANRGWLGGTVEEGLEVVSPFVQFP